MSQWRLLLGMATAGLDRLRASGHPVPGWVLGGGTGLMLHTGHRLSKDIDAFITDPQYLSVLSPRLAGEDIWNCKTYYEATNHLKLVYSEGEIDFIVAAAITDLPPERKVVDADRPKADTPHTIDVEHPVEIALKKLTYRGSLLKVRDIFDIAVVDSGFRDLLYDNLRHVSRLKPGILARMAGISEDFCREELAELDIADKWRPTADTCLTRMREIAENIPEMKRTP